MRGLWMRQYVLSPHIVWLWYDQERLVSAGPSMWSRAGYSATHFPVAEARIICVNMSLNVCVCASFRVCLTTVWWSALIPANSLWYVLLYDHFANFFFDVLLLSQIFDRLPTFSIKTPYTEAGLSAILRIKCPDTGYEWMPRNVRVSVPRITWINFSE